MATQAAFHEQHEALSAVIRAWERRSRAQQTLLWLPFGISAGLALGIGAALAARLFPVLTTPQAALLALLALALAAAVTLLLAWLRPRSTLDSARRFDLLFGLNERTSTALELAAGRIHTRAELAERQLADAWEAARAVDARARLPLRPGGRAWLLPAALAAALALALLLPNPQAEAASQNAARDAALAAARDDLTARTQDAAAISALAEEQRAPLLEQLDRAAAALKEPGVTAEEAFAALAAAAAEMDRLAAELSRQAGDSRAADQQAAEALRAAAPPAGQSADSQPAETIPTLERTAEQAPQMDAQQREDAARALEAAADALEAANPQAAEALREAADALRRGDAQAAQDALQRAVESLQAGQQQAQRQQQAAAQLSAGAQQLQQSADQIARSQGQQQAGQQQAAQMQQGGEQAAAGLQALGQQAGEQGQAGQQGQAGAASQPGEQGGEQGQPGGARGIQPAPGQDSAEAGARSDEPGGVGSGAGDQPGGVGAEDSGPAGRAGAAATNNQPDGAGVGEFAEVYAPQRVGGEGGPQIVLEPDSSGLPVTEGEFSDNPTGEARVPYNQVFGAYSRSASRALNSGYIPLRMRDIVRDYFSALEPRAGSGGE